jgi:Icc-related predicted phosphoesterase
MNDGSVGNKLKMNLAFFVSDLHGHKDRYDKLFEQIRKEQPAVVFIGGDLLPNFVHYLTEKDFIIDFLIPGFQGLRDNLAEKYPVVFMIMGNDDPRIEEENLLLGEKKGLWIYIHNRKITFQSYRIYGYACVPPTPFRLKDWERYDVSRYVDPGSVPPTEGNRTVDTGEDIEYCTIKHDLEMLTGDDDLTRTIFLFHTPPYQTNLDRAALDDLIIEHVPLDVHVGSIAVKQFIEERKPMITLHGHVHESSRITGSWSEKIGNTWAFNAAFDQKELSIIKFRIDHPEFSERLII